VCGAGAAGLAALLSAAAPATFFRWTEQPIRRSERFLGNLWDFAEPRLREWGVRESDEIETTARARRRLKTWLRVAIDKVMADVERMRMDRATHNVALLLTRIEDFEKRALAEADELASTDRVAIGVSLLTLIRLLAPFAPHISEELWQRAGNGEPLISAPWPSSETFSEQHASVAQLAKA
jgi:leucyl-tRNA synthetase